MAYAAFVCEAQAQRVRTLRSNVGFVCLSPQQRLPHYYHAPNIWKWNDADDAGDGMETGGGDAGDARPAESDQRTQEHPLQQQRATNKHAGIHHVFNLTQT